MVQLNKCDQTFVRIPCGSIMLEGNLSTMDDSVGIVLFVHGSGSSRKSPRNIFVANILNQNGISTLLFDLLTAEEDIVDSQTGHLRFDISLLSDRLANVTDWMLKNHDITSVGLGYFGASTGAAAALVAASRRPDAVKAVVSRGGRPDLAGPILGGVKCPTLLLVGGRDGIVIDLNKDALRKIGTTKKEMVIIPEATHLFEESGKMEMVAKYASDWFLRYLGDEK